MTMPDGWREVRPGLYERIDTPETLVLSPEFVEEFVRASGGSPAFRELAERARAQSLRTRGTAAKS